MGIGSHTKANRGATDEWLTPRPIVDGLGPFDLDPCSPIARPWPTAAAHLTSDDDGLSKPWTGRVWCNPPYGRETGRWLARLAEHGDGIALIFARTEVAFFVDSVWGKADAVFFIHGRLRFCYPNGIQAKANAGGPSCFVAYGARNVDALARSPVAGTLVDLRQQHLDRIAGTL